ncbi:unnamed protein product, partial [Rotaria sp. Silwood2]
SRWEQNGVTVGAGHGNGSDLNQVWAPLGICVDENQNVFVVDSVNNRIVEWKVGAKEGVLAFGGDDFVEGSNKLAGPSDVIFDQRNNNFIIADCNNQRVVRWILGVDTVHEIIATDIDCKGLAIDENNSIYVTDNARDEVVRYDVGDSEGTIVAGGNGKGDGLNQLNSPYRVFVDQDYSVYVSDEDNHRVMKWTDGATEGIVVAGGQGAGGSLSQIHYPRGIFVDNFGTLYAVDYENARVVRWLKDAVQGEVIVGGNGEGKQANQLCSPNGIAFDNQGNLYVVDSGNARVQKFNII